MSPSPSTAAARRYGDGSDPARPCRPVNRFSLYLPCGRGACAGEYQSGQPGGDLARRKAHRLRRVPRDGAPSCGSASTTSSKSYSHPGDRGRRGTPFFSPDGRQLGSLLIGWIEASDPCRSTGWTERSHSRTARTRPAATGVRGRLRVLRGGLGSCGRIRATGRADRAALQFCAHGEEDGAEWPVVLPGAKGLTFLHLVFPDQLVGDFQIVGDGASGTPASRTC